MSPKDARRGRLVQMQLHDRGRPTRTAVFFIRKVSDGERAFKGKGGRRKRGDVGLFVTIRVRQRQTTDRPQPIRRSGTYGDERLDLPGVTKLLKEWTFQRKVEKWALNSCRGCRTVGQAMGFGRV